MTRQTKTPAQRAQEAVDVLTRRITRLVEKRHHLVADLDALDDELDENRLRLEYARQNPDLPGQQQDTTTTGAATA